MATIANLVVEIGSKTKNLQKGLKKSIGSVKKFSASAVKAMAKFGAAMSAIVVGSGAAILAWLSSATAGIDKLAKTSSKLGIAVNELQKLHFQAKLSGVSVDTMSMALQRMVRRVSEAGKGTGEAKDALKELGINAQELAKLSPDQQFQKISEAMKNIGSQGDKVRLAMKIFDTEGVSLVNTMNSNLEETGKQFEALGVSLSKSQAAAAEGFQDSLTVLGTLWEGFKQQLAATLAGPAKGLIDWVKEYVKSFGGMDKLAQKVGSTIISVAKNMKDAFVAVKAVIDAILAGLNAIKNIIPAISKGLGVDNLTSSLDAKLQKMALSKGIDPAAFGAAPTAKSSVPSISTSSEAARGQQNAQQLVKVAVELDEGLILKKLDLDAKYQAIVDKQLEESRRNAARQTAR